MTAPLQLLRAGRIPLALVAILVAGVSVLLLPQWLRNPDLSHGLFMPVVFFFLLHEARTGTPRHLRENGLHAALAALALVGGILGLCAAGLYAAALDQSHVLVGFAAAASLSLLLLGAVVVFAGDRVRALPLNWSSVLAAGLWVLCAPIPPGTYNRLSLALQLKVSENVVGILHLIGIPADRSGNVIQLANTAVGIEDACSGVRSLVSCVFAGLFFSGCMVRGTGGRILLIAIAAPLALAMNFIRSLALTLMANANVDIAGRWHDITGFGVLGITAAILGAIAWALARREPSFAQASQGRRESLPAVTDLRAPVSRRPDRLLSPFLGAAVVIAILFALRIDFSSGREAPAPNLDAVLPEAAPGWTVITSGDLNRFRAALQTDHFLQRTYARKLPNGQDLLITAYVAYWGPGQASASLVATHTPDACWPGAGWTAIPAEPSKVALDAGGRALPPAEYRVFQNRDIPQHVWFWHLYDGEPIRYIDPLSPTNLLEIALRYGFRRAGDQMFIRLSSNRPWAEIAGEPLVGDLAARLQPLGL